MKTITLVAALLGLGLSVESAAAQGGPGRPPQAVVLVRAGDLFDSETGRMVGPRDILVRGQRVVEVGRDLAAPQGATVVDLRACKVLPGLIDAHTHLLVEQDYGEDLSLIAARDRTMLGDAYRVMQGARRGRDYLSAGFTSVRDLGNSGRFLDLALKQAINDGLTPGPRIYSSGPGLAPAGGQLSPMMGDGQALIDGEYRIVAGVEDGRAAVREAVARGADVIKIYPEATPQRTRMTTEEMAAIVAEAHRHRLPVAAHATFDEAIREAVEAGVDSIEHGYEVSDATLRLMAQRKVWLTPTDPSLEMALTFASNWPRKPPQAEVEAQLERFRDRVRRARAQGVRIVLGSDLYFPFPEGRGLGSVGTLEGYVEDGMTPAQALQSATKEAAALLRDDGLGAIKARGWADLVAMPNDPTVSIKALREVRFVMKAGKVELADAGACAGSGR